MKMLNSSTQLCNRIQLPSVSKSSWIVHNFDDEGEEGVHTFDGSGLPSAFDTSAAARPQSSSTAERMANWQKYRINEQLKHKHLKFIQNIR